MTDREHPDRGTGRELPPERLRALLEDAVADVQPAPALDRIRSRTKVTPMRHTRPWLLVAAGAVAATAATVTAVALADGPSDRTDPGPGPAATSTDDPTTTAGPSDDPTPTPTESPSESPSSQPEPGAGLLPLYVVGDTPTGPRLFREFQPAPAGTSTEDSARLLAALGAAIDGEVSDPDYRSGWPAEVSVEEAGGNPTGPDGSVQVTLATTGQDLAQRPAGMSEGEAVLALQQLVYTVQAVLQERAPVSFVGAEEGLPLDTVLGVEVGDSYREAPAAEVQAPVWITTPQDGQQVGRTFTVEGRGAFFEANVSWQLLSDGAVVEEGFATARECCTLAPYSFEVEAAPGDYVLRVYDADMSGGEGNGEQEDTKRITVQ